MLANPMTVVEVDSNALFSVLATPTCSGACYSFHRISPLYH